MLEKMGSAPGWGGWGDRREDGVSCRVESQSKHVEIGTEQIGADRNVFLVDNIMDTTNVLISWLTNDGVDGLWVKYSTVLLDRVEVMMGQCVVCEDDARQGVWWGRKAQD